MRCLREAKFVRQIWLIVVVLTLGFAVTASDAYAQCAGVIAGANCPPQPTPPTPPTPPDPGRDPSAPPNLPELPDLPGFNTPQAVPGAFVTDRVLLLIPVASPAGAAQQIATPLGLSVVNEFDLQTVGLHAAVLALPPGFDVVSAIEFLSLTPNVLAQPVYRYSQSSGQGYANELMQVSTAHQFATGNRVTVAVIDTAIDIGHPQISGQIAASQNFVGSTAPDVHGTAVAGLISGVAPGARLLAITALAANNGSGTSVEIARAIDYAVLAGARVLNMSFEGYADPIVNQLTQTALGRGAIVVAAAGNGGPGAAPSWPAAVPGVIAVTATGPDDELYASANHGSYISVAAPGVDVLTIAPQGRVGVLSGTSMAAAHVSGLVALLLERNPSASPAQIRAVLEGTAIDLGPPGRDTSFGAGRVNAIQAIQSGF